MSLEPEMPVQEPVASADEAAPRRNARSRDFDRELGAKLRAARVSTGMNQTALGKALGVSFQQVQKYESGRDRIAAGTLQKIGGVLGIHPGEFFGETTAPVGGVAELREAMSIAATMQKVVSPVVSSASLERRRAWTGSGWMPPVIAARFTMGEAAAIGVVMAEIAGNRNLPNVISIISRELELWVRTRARVERQGGGCRSALPTTNHILISFARPGAPAWKTGLSMREVARSRPDRQSGRLVLGS